MASSTITSWQINGEKMETVTDFIFLGSKTTVDGDWSHEIKRCLPLGRKGMTYLDSMLKSKAITLPTKVNLVKTGFSNSHVQMLKLDHKEGWAPKNFPTVVLENTLESPLDSKEIKPVNSKGNQTWVFIGRTDTEAPILWPPDVKSWLIGKDLMLWKIEGRRRRGRQRMRWLDGITDSTDEFEQTPGNRGQGSLMCCSPWGRKESDTTEWLRNNNNNLSFLTISHTLENEKKIIFLSPLSLRFEIIFVHNVSFILCYVDIQFSQHLLS